MTIMIANAELNSGKNLYKDCNEAIIFLLYHDYLYVITKPYNFLSCIIFISKILILSLIIT